MSEKQGVAQRVMDKFEASRQHDFDSDEERMKVIGHLVGAWYMHRELSAEARRVMAEHDQHVEQDGYGFWFIEIEVLRNAFTRLGLDLNEPEDSDE